MSVKMYVRDFGKYCNALRSSELFYQQVQYTKTLLIFHRTACQMIDFTCYNVSMFRLPSLNFDYEFIGHLKNHVWA